MPRCWGRPFQSIYICSQAIIPRGHLRESSWRMVLDLDLLVARESLTRLWALRVGQVYKQHLLLQDPVSWPRGQHGSASSRAGASLPATCSLRLRWWPPALFNLPGKSGRPSGAPGGLLELLGKSGWGPTQQPSRWNPDFLHICPHEHGGHFQEGRKGETGRVCTTQPAPSPPAGAPELQPPS